MNKQTEALKMAIEALEKLAKLGNGDAYGNSIGNDIAINALKKIKACKDALKQPQCNPHPKAPHGFSRDASHSADRYVCDCEGWDAWQDGYEEGLSKGLELEQPAQEPVGFCNLPNDMNGIDAINEFHKNLIRSKYGNR